MKKTIIALFALAGVAAAETVSLVLPDSGTATYGADWLNVQQNADISQILTANKDKAPGVYVASNGNNLTNYGVSGEGTWVNSENSGTITLCGRSRAYGDYLAIILSPSSFTAGTTVTEITFGAGEISGVVSTYTLQVGIFNSGENGASSLSSTSNYSSEQKGASVTLTLNDGWKWNESDRIVAVLRGGSGDPTSAYTVSGINMSAKVNASAPAAPEPTTATLSLLALAGLAARRRRR